jgi:hypothetical protein
MTDDRHLRGLEARLSAVPPIHQVSAELRRVCLAAAFADDRPAARRSRRPFRPRMWSAVAAAGVAVGACVAIVHLPAERPRHAVQRVVHLRNSGTAVGVVRIGPPVGGNDPVVVSIAHLPPAGAGRHYDMGFQTQAGTTRARAFDTTAMGSARLRFTAAAKAGLTRCWVTLETAGRPGDSAVVMRAASAAPQDA